MLDSGCTKEVPIKNGVGHINGRVHRAGGAAIHLKEAKGQTNMSYGRTRGKKEKVLF